MSFSRFLSWAFLCVCILGSSEAQAKGKLKQKLLRLDSVLAVRYFHTSYDTNYVVRPEGRLTLKLKVNQTGNSIHAKGTVKDVYSKANLHTRHKTTISLGASYRGISAAFSLNPAKMGGIYKDYELNVNYYGSRFSLDASYQRSSSLSGDVERNGPQRLEEGDVNMKVFNIAGYYVFNHRRFSFPAAFTQSYVHRRSAGSWLAGISYQGGTIKTTEDFRERHPEANDMRLSVGHLGIGGGYGYNLVLRKKWLLHLSLLPTFVVYNRNKITVNGESRHASGIRFNMLFNERAAIIYNYSPRYFAGLNAVMNNSLFTDKNVIINQNKWVVRAFFGVRLW